MAEKTEIKPQGIGKILQFRFLGKRAKTCLKKIEFFFLLKIKISSVTTDFNIQIKLLSGFDHSANQGLTRAVLSRG